MKAAGQTVRPVKGLKKETDFVVIAHHTADIWWMEEILRELIRGYPTIYRASTIQGGAGFLTSTVWRY